MIEIINQKSVLTTIPFTVEELEVSFAGHKAARPYHRLKTADWVNVLPVTASGEAVLIRQPRIGSASMVLETPGGVMDPGEKDATMTAARELEEETGYMSQRILPLAVINPNPAIMQNRCHFMLALGCQLNPQRRHFPESDEHIKVELHALASLDQMIRTGEINHALSALCIYLAQRYLT